MHLDGNINIAITYSPGARRVSRASRGSHPAREMHENDFAAGFPSALPCTGLRHRCLLIQEVTRERGEQRPPAARARVFPSPQSRVRTASGETGFEEEFGHRSVSGHTRAQPFFRLAAYPEMHLFLHTSLARVPLPPGWETAEQARRGGRTLGVGA